MKGILRKFSVPFADDVVSHLRNERIFKGKKKHISRIRNIVFCIGLSFEIDIGFGWFPFFSFGRISFIYTVQHEVKFWQSGTGNWCIGNSKR